MRFNDVELFELPDRQLDGMKTKYSFDKFCGWAIVRLNKLIKESTKNKNWIDPKVTYMRNYRTKSVKFYEEKRAKKCLTK